MSLNSFSSPGSLGSLSRRRVLVPLLRHGTLILASLVFSGPFAWMILTSLKSSGEALAYPPTFLPRQWKFGNFVELFQTVPFGRYLLNSLVVTTLTVCGQVVTSLAAGYAFARLRFRGSGVLFVVLLAALLVPFEVVFTPLVSLLSSFGWLNSYRGLVIPNIPSILGVFLFRQFFLSFPSEIEDASRLDGAGVWRRLWSIAAPMAAPMTGSFAILSFVYNWNNFFFQFLVVNKPSLFTVPIGLAQLQSTNTATSFNLLMAGSALAVIPMFVVFLLFQKQIVRGISGSLR
jgi:multiple sugar transport system permease protein/sn-glycerol 3-phosphate transport system permease protein